MAGWKNFSRFLATPIAVAVCVFALSTPASAQRQAEDRAKVVAAFLYKFLTFVEWPETAFASSSDAFRIAVLYDEEVTTAVRESVAGKEVKGRTVEVDAGGAAEDALADCHVLFVGTANEARLRDALERADGRPVLTVGLDDRFANRGGIIRLFEKDRRLNIEVNLAAAQQADLKISSKLLAVAKVLREADLNTQAERDDNAELLEPAASSKVD